MKIRFAVLAAMVVATLSAVACTQSPTASDRRAPSHASFDGTTTSTSTDTTSRGGGTSTSGH